MNAKPEAGIIPTAMEIALMKQLSQERLIWELKEQNMLFPKWNKTVTCKYIAYSM